METIRRPSQSKDMLFRELAIHQSTMMPVARGTQESGSYSTRKSPAMWWSSQGGLHGIEPAPEKRGTRGAPIISQYFEAFPGHAARLERVLDGDLAERWNRLADRLSLSTSHLPEADRRTTRGDWIRAAYAASQ